MAILVTGGAGFIGSAFFIMVIVLSDRNVLYESFDCFVSGETELAI